MGTLPESSLYNKKKYTERRQTMPAIQLMTASSTETTPVAETSGARNTKTQGLQNTFSNYMRQNSSHTAQTAKDQAAIPQAKAAA